MKFTKFAFGLCIIPYFTRTLNDIIIRSLHKPLRIRIIAVFPRWAKIFISDHFSPWWTENSINSSVFLAVQYMMTKLYCLIDLFLVIYKLNGLLCDNLSDHFRFKWQLLLLKIIWVNILHGSLIPIGSWQIKGKNLLIL